MNETTTRKWRWRDRIIWLIDLHEYVVHEPAENFIKVQNTKYSRDNDTLEIGPGLPGKV